MNRATQRSHHSVNYSENVARVIESLRWWRVPEFVGLAMILAAVLLVEESASEYKRYIPSNSAQGVNSYPVKLDDEWCSASDISYCTDSVSVCCSEVAAGTEPSETVSSLELGLMCALLPFIFVIARDGFIKYAGYSAVGRTQDAFLGLALTLGICFAVTNGVKLLVGRPRPNYFALQALVEYRGSDYSSWKSTSTRSFPSGHASVAMAGMSFITLLCWRDLKSQSLLDPSERRITILAYASLLPLLYGLWVGITRIRDYWHFEDDILAGWIIGAICAAVAIYWVIPAVEHDEHEGGRYHSALHTAEQGEPWRLMSPTYNYGVDTAEENADNEGNTGRE